MNQKQAKALRKALGYDPRDPPREYIRFINGYKLRPNYKVHSNGKIELEYEEVPRYQIMYDDQLRKLYKTMKRKWVDPNANQMNHFKWVDSDKEEETNE